MAPERIITSTSSHDDDTSSNEVHQQDIEGAECITPMDLDKHNTAASATSSLNQRAQSVISRIRSRDPAQVANFTHPLSHTKTSPDVLVVFDGEDDPYRPRNWPFRKKAITTLLYGLTTMGEPDTFPARFFWLMTCLPFLSLQVLHGQVPCTISRSPRGTRCHVLTIMQVQPRNSSNQL